MKRFLFLFLVLIAVVSFGQNNWIDWRYGKPGIRVTTNAPPESRVNYLIQVATNEFRKSFVKEEEDPVWGAEKDALYDRLLNIEVEKNLWDAAYNHSQTPHKVTVGGGFQGGVGAITVYGGAVGAGAETSDGFAGGKGATTIDLNGLRIDAVQLGEGNNPIPRTGKLYDDYIATLGYVDSSVNNLATNLSAQSANYAEWAYNATNALHADYADESANATHALNADHAYVAEFALESGLAGTAGSADTAGYAQFAEVADSANYAEWANNATNALHADYADEAGYAPEFDLRALRTYHYGSRDTIESSSVWFTASNDGYYNVVHIASEAKDLYATMIIPWEVDGMEISTIGYFGGSKLFSATLPRSITRIESMAFNSCPNLYDLNTGNIEWMNGMCFANTPLASSDWSNLKTISADGFAYSSFGVIKLPSIEFLGNGGFVDAKSLSNLVFGAGLKTIDNQVGDFFAGCTNLFRIELQGEPPEVTRPGHLFTNAANCPAVIYATNPRATGWSDTWLGRPVVRPFLMADDFIIDGVSVTNLVKHPSNHGVTVGGGFYGGDGAVTTTGGAVGNYAATTDGGAVGNNAISDGGGAVGSGAEATYGGAVGRYAGATTGGAVGRHASAIAGGAVGDYAISDDGGAVGNNARAELGGAVGNYAITTDGGAVGMGAMSGDGFAGGKNATTLDTYGQPIDAVQFGDGNNPTPRTGKLYDEYIATKPYVQNAISSNYVEKATQGWLLYDAGSNVWLRVMVSNLCFSVYEVIDE